MIFWGPQTVAEYTSKYSGRLKVVKGGGGLYVSTGGLTQSGGLVSDVWRPVIRKIARKNKSWLILGVATGTVARLIPDPQRIVGVDIDPVMLTIGRTYFHLDHVPNLTIVNLDARRYILTARGRFDYILVDLYLEDRVPDFVYQEKFLARLANIGKVVVFNHLFYDAGKKARAEILVHKVQAVFSQVRLERYLTNLLIICS